MKLLSIYRRLIATALAAAVLVAYGLGSVVTWEIVHHHHADGDHHHVGEEHLVVHHDDPSHHDDGSTPDEDQDDDNGPADSHSHCVASGLIGPAVCADQPSSCMPVETCETLDLPVGDNWLEGPLFEQFKPPRLG